VRPNDAGSRAALNAFSGAMPLAGKEEECIRTNALKPDGIPAFSSAQRWRASMGVRSMGRLWTFPPRGSVWQRIRLPLQPRTLFWEFSLSSSLPRTLFRARGKLVWAHSSAPSVRTTVGAMSLGLQFTSMDPPARNLLLKALQGEHCREKEPPTSSQLRQEAAFLSAWPEGYAPDAGWGTGARLHEASWTLPGGWNGADGRNM